jgi:hypothetical protein
MSARWKHVVSYDCDEHTAIDVGLFDLAIAEGFAAIEQNELSVGMGFSDAGRSPLKSGSSAPGWYKGIYVAPPPLTRSVLLTEIKHELRKKVAQIESTTSAAGSDLRAGFHETRTTKRSFYFHPCPTGASLGSFALKHHFNSWLSSLISIPAITMNLQLSISRGSSSSGSWHVTRQYWQS